MTREQANREIEQAQLAYTQFEVARQAGDEDAMLAQYRRALEHFRRALKLLPEDATDAIADVHNQLGSIFAGTEQLDKALGHFRRAIDNAATPHARGLYTFNLALALWDEGRHDDALKTARVALPDFEAAGALDRIVQVQHMVALIAVDLARFDEARQAAQLALGVASRLGVDDSAIRQLIQYIDGRS